VLAAAKSETPGAKERFQEGSGQEKSPGKVPGLSFRDPWDRAG